MIPAGTVEVLGVRFHNLSRSEAARAIALLAKSQSRVYVVKPYSEFMPRAAAESETRRLLNGAALCLPDGITASFARFRCPPSVRD